jgi:hypothetical protein
MVRQATNVEHENRTRESQTAKCSSSCCAYNQTLSEEREERMEIDNNNGDFEESSDIAEPLEIIR